MKNYFKKFSIMFIMLLAVLGIGTIQNGNIANAATIGQQLTQPESGWKRYDDTDDRIQYIGTWGTWNDVYRSGPGMHYTTTLGSYITTKFHGTKFRYINAYDSTEPNGLAWQISIDGVKYPLINPHYGSNPGISPALMFEVSGLEKGDHDVKIECIANNGFKLGLDGIDIDDTGYLINPNESISLDKSSIDLNIDGSQQLTATTTPSGATVNWTSSDSSIATVDSTGKITAIKDGQAVITATTADGLTATCAVTVIPKTAEPTNPDPDSTDSEKIVNIAHAKGDNTNNAGGDVTIIFHGAADTTLSVVKTADVKDVWLGDNFTYTIVVTNTGTKTAKAVVVNDPAPNHIDFVVNGITTTQGTVDSSSTSKNIIVNVGDIAPGATVTIKIPATVVL